MSFLCKQESPDYVVDSRFRENDSQIEIYFSKVSLIKQESLMFVIKGSNS